MRIEQLHYLSEIIQCRSFSLAAERLYISQQSLSESISKLEQEFDIQLLIRSRKGITLTGPGQIFFKDAEEILAIYDRMQTTFKNIPSLEPDVFHIAANTYYNSTSIPSILPKFREKFPDITISLKEYGSCHDVLRKVIEGEADLGLTTINAKWLKSDPLLLEHNNKTFLIHKLNTDALCALVPGNHPLTNQTPLNVDLLFDYPLVVDATNQLIQYLATIDKHKDPNILLATSNAIAYYKAIEENNAIGFATEHASRLASEALAQLNIQAVPFDKRFQLQISVIIPTNKHTAAPLRELIKLADQYYKNKKKPFKL